MLFLLFILVVCFCSCSFDLLFFCSFVLLFFYSFILLFLFFYSDKDAVADCSLIWRYFLFFTPVNIIVIFLSLIFFLFFSQNCEYQ